ncbi:hypothetical protein AVEN_257023-1 [Araneus ventricosus]|uniref:Endonuclease/exonuclease/phosphatase domain-containing protein n=1 Tax=Araneus ventricosus TaxID=182803 RepID=A0A4Y2VJI0_ARAVE|nr:hypothetical protein AVEN_257023-1 [Araneus ventricosus]
MSISGVALEFARQKVIINTDYGDPYISDNFPLTGGKGRRMFCSFDNKSVIYCLNRDLDIVLGHNTNHIVGLVVKLGVLDLKIISAYFPPHDNIDSLIEEFTNFNSINKNVLILGDFNARSFIWNYNFEDICGSAIIDFSTMNDLLICNNKNSPPTFVSHSGRDWPDLTLANSNIFNFITKLEITDLEPLSDHRYVSVQLDFDDPNINDFHFKTTYSKPKFVQNFQKLLPDLYSKLENVKDRVSLDLFFKFFVDSVSECAYKSYRKKAKGRLPRKFSFWNPELRTLRNKATAL